MGCPLSDHSAAVGIWCRNVMVVGVWYWELDRGGPIRRCTAEHPQPDFLFPQMQSPAVQPGSWSPRFPDYLYVSLATVAVVGARAVNILG